MIDRSNNLWWASAGWRPPAPVIAGDLRCDVVVVGAGIMGATTAQSLAAAGLDVVVLEAGEVGAGASSTPGGFVVPHFSVGSPRTIIERVGDVGAQLVEATGRSAALLFDKIRDLGIACDARQDGWFQPAHSRRALATIEAVADQWKSHGLDVELLCADATTARTGVDHYHGSWFAPSGGTLHPLLFCRGLADAAVKSGARLFEFSPVLSIERQGLRQIVRSAGGRVSADRVVICANGLAPALAPQLADAMIPLDVWQCATAPIPPHDRAHLFQRGEALSDTREHLFTYRVDQAGRIITGALDAFGLSPAAQAGAMARRLQRMLRLPDVPQISHVWRGTASVSAPRYPATLLVDGGVISATACNARGIALSTMVGDSLARHLVTGELPPIPMLEAGSARSAALQRRLRRFYPLLGPVLDWIDARRPAPRRERR